MSKNESTNIPASRGSSYRLRSLPGLVAILSFTLVAGCSSLGPYSGQSGAGAATGPVIAAEPVPPPPEIPVAGSANEPARPAPAPPPAPVPARTPRVLLINSSNAENYTGVATALSALHSSSFEFESFSLDSDAAALAAATATADWSAVVAIGLDAALYAADHIDAPTVFCQILDYESLLEGNPELTGVEPMPPLGLQLAGWKSVEPNAGTVGIIVQDGRTDLAAEAAAAASELGLELRAAFAATDRDAIYQFKRFAQNVDALWLLPDSRILSPTAIREMLDYALDHGVRTIVFNKTLLDWGALLSVGSKPEDVAAAVASQLQAIADRSDDQAERMKPLTAIDLQINPAVAEKLGLPGTAAPTNTNQLVSARGDDT